MQQTPQEPYSSCPHCLTKIELIDTPQKVEEKSKTPILEVQPKINHADLEIKHSKNNKKPATCQYYLGYLSERTSKQQIPDNCLFCRDTVECMLMKMREKHK